VLPQLTPEQVGAAITGIVTGSGDGNDRDAYMITSAGLSPAP